MSEKEEALSVRSGENEEWLQKARWDEGVGVSAFTFFILNRLRNGAVYKANPVLAACYL